MTSIYIDSTDDDNTRRARLYQGDIYVYSATDLTRSFCEFAANLIKNAFGDLDPEAAQHSMEVESYAKLLGKLKPEFIHHPESKRYLQEILAERGCNLNNTYFEVPKMRSSTSDGYLTAGVAYAWHPHRDTWYSAPQCQLNWWLPIFDIQSTNCMSFHPRYWQEAVPNSSEEYNYYHWNEKHRGQHITEYINKDPRPLPKPTGKVEIEPDLRVVCPPGGMIIFSGAQLHSSVPNNSGKTRFSIDFRTVHDDDLHSRKGAPNIDSKCTGTVLSEFLQAKDQSEMPDEIVALYQDGSEHLGRSVYKDNE